MPPASDPHAEWTAQVLRILEDEFQADPALPAPAGGTLKQGFAPVAHWVARALVPLIRANARLRGERVPAPVTAEAITGPDADPTALQQLIDTQLRMSFPFDAYFDAMHQSALDFAAENAMMITEHFDNAENYAEIYAQSSCEMMQRIAARGTDRPRAARMLAAFQRADVAAWAACYPGSFMRGILTANALAQGPTDQATLASDLKRELFAAFAAHDNDAPSGEDSGPKQP
ncbi:hypothetical protein KDD17_01700 [Sulfitobacter albidus]|uniref:Uncharacterized protein n=1 Tax=Sulfitobacter albidus TaxID=2829501 RepID=A0A975PMH4_9RHOB|nr:hypothetical protein [Sulfitobacter albidus]QUJ76802.1 hypothetical protein KDD17_01700 [Sulfitobacter albidus]